MQLCVALPLKRGTSWHASKFFTKETHNCMNVPLRPLIDCAVLACSACPMLRGRNAGPPHPPHSPGRAVFPHPVPRSYSLPRKARLLSVSSSADFCYAWQRYLYLVENLVEFLPGETLSLSAPSIQPLVLLDGSGPNNQQRWRANTLKSIL